MTDITSMVTGIPLVNVWVTWASQDPTSFAALVIISFLLAFLIGFRQGSPIS